VNEVSLTKTPANPSTSLPAGRPSDAEPGGLDARVADVLGDEAPETLATLPKGRGIEVRDRNGRRVSTIATGDYLTHFETLSAVHPNKADLVLYTYPNASGGGTFTVTTGNEQRLASWEEQMPPGRFVVGGWDDGEGIFYLRAGRLVIRARDGSLLADLPVPESDPYDVRRTLSFRGHTVVLASGGGYTPFHMVLIVERRSRLLFAEVGRDQALRLEASGDDGFIVHTRSTSWRYSLPAAAVP
jgi:hypothetical protein